MDEARRRIERKGAPETLYYLPGCDVNANHPAAGAKLRDYLLSQGGVREAPCCRKDVSALEPGDTVIQNCTFCQLMLAEHVPEVRVTSLYEHLLADGAFPWPDFAGRTASLQNGPRELPPYRMGRSPPPTLAKPCTRRTRRG